MEIWVYIGAVAYLLDVYHKRVVYSACVDSVEVEKVYAKYDVPFYYLIEMDCIMFQDCMHMNNTDAEKYTQ